MSIQTYHLPSLCDEMREVEKNTGRQEVSIQEIVSICITMFMHVTKQHQCAYRAHIQLTDCYSSDRLAILIQAIALHAGDSSQLASQRAMHDGPAETVNIYAAHGIFRATSLWVSIKDRSPEAAEEYEQADRVLHILDAEHTVLGTDSDHDVFSIITATVIAVTVIGGGGE